MGADVRLLLVVLLLALAAQGAARVHTVLLTPSTPSPAWLPAGAGDALNFTLAAGRPAARVVQSSRAAPCNPLVHGFARVLDVGAPFFLWHSGAEGVDEAEVWFYIDGECDEGQRREGAQRQRLARRKDLDWAQLWGIVLGIAFGLVALAAFACCSWCCCFQHRVRAHQARLHVRDEGVQTGAAHNTELPLYERRVRVGEVQLEEAPAPDYHLATRAAAAGVGVGVGAVEGQLAETGEVEGQGPEGVPAAPERVPLPPSPTATSPPDPATLTSPGLAPRDPPTQMSMPVPQPYVSAPQPYASGSSPPPTPDDLPPAYSHAPP